MGEAKKRSDSDKRKTDVIEARRVKIEQQTKFKIRHEATVPDYVTSDGMRWTFKRWFCLHSKWERLGYCEYGTAGGYAWVAKRCLRCGVTRTIQERI